MIVGVIKRFWGVFLFACGLSLIGWIAYNLFIERLPETQGRNPIGPSLFAIALLGLGWKRMLGKPVGKSPTKKINYAEIRMLWINGRHAMEAKNPTYIGELQTYAAGMEFTIPQASGTSKKVLVLGSSDGDASVYFESNNAQGSGGFIGGVTHETTAKAGRTMTAVAAENVKQMAPTENFPEVLPGKVRFIVLAKQGLYTTEVAEQEVTKEVHPLYYLWSAGQNIITQYRLLPPQKQKAG